MKKITKQKIANSINVTNGAIVYWQSSNKIPAEACMKLEPILNIPAKQLFDNPHLLFDMFPVRNKLQENNDKKAGNKSIPKVNNIGINHKKELSK